VLTENDKTEVHQTSLEKQPTVTSQPIIGLSAINYERASVVYKVKVDNQAPYPLSDVKVKPYFDEHLFVADEDFKRIALLKRGEAKTVTFHLRPKGECGNTNLGGKVTYFDTRTEKHGELELKSRETAVVCPMLKRKEIDEVTWRSSMGDSVGARDEFKDIPMGASNLFSVVSRVLQDLNLFRLKPQVTEDEQLFQGVAMFHAQGVKGLAYGVRVEVIGGSRKATLLLATYAPDEASLIGFSHRVLDEIEKRTDVKDYLTGDIFHIHRGDYVAGDKIEVRDAVVSRSTIGGGEPVTKSNDEPAPPAGGSDGDAGAGYDPKVEKKRIKAEVKKMKKPGFSASRTGNIFWIDELNIVCLQLYLYNKSFNKGKGRPHIPLDKTVEEIRQLLGKTEGAIKMQVKGFSNWDPKWVGKPTKAREASRPRVWNEWHDSDPYVLTAEANKNLELYERGEL